ncbi:MAG: hypothetical protein HY710_05810 [Candidatus Latescibacteria bacterium]|nr:hypothetical protein [Candidatus Latescibacterota bacterium]
MPTRFFVSVSFQVIVVCLTARCLAQEITKDNYLKYVPLSSPPILCQTEASRDLCLYGNEQDTSSYKDGNLDGIDDSRYQRLKELCVKFSPILFKNDYMIPLNFRAFIKDGVTPLLYSDTWDLTRAEHRVITRETINLALADPLEDVKLLHLIRETHPDSLRTAKVQPTHQTLKVLYFDFPGEDETTWKQAYHNIISKDLQRSYQEYSMIYAHPFIHEPQPDNKGKRGYEFVIQYWFFYPFNDGANNHEGDWEHLNVIVTSKMKADSLLSQEEVWSLLQVDGYTDMIPDSSWVIKRVEYYFHQLVTIWDYTRPNVYLDAQRWKAEVERSRPERKEEQRKWEWVRARAFQDDGTINTHPIGYIAGDNKGFNQLLALPGGKNRDSHGTYPIPGIYKGVGAIGATEQIHGSLNYRQGLQRRSQFVSYTDDQIELVPDWERVKDLVLQSPQARRNWSWLILPVRWGFPATASPGAGIVPNADTGNLGIVGPAYQTAWNRVGACDRFALYDPHIFSSAFPMSPVDNFSNRWGFLNATLPTVLSLPTYNYLWGFLIKPLVVDRFDPPPLFISEDIIPFRRVGFVFGVSPSFEDDAFALLLHNERLRQFIQAYNLVRRLENRWTLSYYGQLNFYLGRRLASENLFRVAQSTVRYSLTQPPKVLASFEGDLRLIELSGSLRYNFLPERFQPFLKSGYGYTIYKVRSARPLITGTLDQVDPATIEGLVDRSATAWFHHPKFWPPQRWWPNTWHFGFGLEFLPVKSYTSGHMGAKLEYELYVHRLGRETPENATVARQYLNLALTFGF